MKIIDTYTGETLAEILTNHSMTIDEALNLAGATYDGTHEEGCWTFDGETWYDSADLEMVYDG